ncbi:MAG: hypothetical protein L3K26_05480 [Candidatus Hydrogenedentes bacterium]|nr:hypothetical protein [Candidatus Hydrogenedentota bacterium]
MWYVIGIVVLVPVLFTGWRMTSIGRGARQRDERLLGALAPIARKLDAGETVTRQEVFELARQPELRFMLYSMLREIGHKELLPHDFDDPIHQAEAALACWMMHPNELQDAPAEMAYVETVTRSVGGSETAFHVFRYRMADGHWASQNGWLLGLAGPVDESAEPYTAQPSAFSRIDKVEDVTPGKLVDWWVAKDVIVV